MSGSERPGRGNVPLVDFWTLLQRYVDDTGASASSVMKRADMDPKLLTSWRQRGVPILPEHGDLLRLAGALRVDYQTLVLSFLVERSFLPESSAVVVSELQESRESQHAEEA